MISNIINRNIHFFTFSCCFLTACGQEHIYTHTFLFVFTNVMNASRKQLWWTIGHVIGSIPTTPHTGWWRVVKNNSGALVAPKQFCFHIFSNLICPPWAKRWHSFESGAGPLLTLPPPSLTGTSLWWAPHLASPFSLNSYLACVLSGVWSPL